MDTFHLLDPESLAMSLSTPSFFLCIPPEGAGLSSSSPPDALLPNRGRVAAEV